MKVKRAPKKKKKVENAPEKTGGAVSKGIKRELKKKRIKGQNSSFLKHKGKVLVFHNVTSQICL